MRIKFDKCIYLCTKVTHPNNSNLLLITTSNGVYTVDMGGYNNAKIVYDSILRSGYADLSKFDYSN